MPKLWLSLFCLLMIRPAWSQQTGAITGVEAIHLVETILDNTTPGEGFLTERIETAEQNSAPVYVIYGTGARRQYRAVVNADAARVLEIYRNDEMIYKWTGIKVVGHRGSVRLAPENTIPAFEAAIEQGVDLLEMDIRETKDGKLVVIHDKTVDRTTNGMGFVAKMTLAEIKALDAGSWFGAEFKDVRVPTLREALTAIRGKALPDIDFKAGTPEKLIAILADEGLLGKVTLYCGDWDLLQATLKGSDGLMARPTVPGGRSGLAIVLNTIDPPIVNIDWQDFSEPLVRDVHVAGRKSFLNVMQHDNRFAMIKMIDTLPDYIQSDHIDILMPLLRERGLHE